MDRRTKENLQNLHRSYGPDLTRTAAALKAAKAEVTRLEAEDPTLCSPELCLAYMDEAAARRTRDVYRDNYRELRQAHIHAGEARVRAAVGSDPVVARLEARLAGAIAGVIARIR